MHNFIENKLDINFVSIFSENKEVIQLELPLVECATSDTKVSSLIPLNKQKELYVKN